jgi:hypothetical protein
MQKTHVDLLTCPQGLQGPLFQSMDVLMLANQFWRLSNPRKRGHQPKTAAAAQLAGS